MCRLSLEALIRVASCDDDWLMSGDNSPHHPKPMTEEQIKRNAVGLTQKQQPGKDVLVYGSGKPVNTLLQHDLVDELRLMVHPVVLGSGKRLFDDTADTMKILKLGRVEGVSLGHCPPLIPPSKVVMVSNELGVRLSLGGANGPFC